MNLGYFKEMCILNYTITNNNIVLFRDLISGSATKIETCC